MTFAHDRRRVAPAASRSRTYGLRLRWKALLVVFAAACGAGAGALGLAALRASGAGGARPAVLALLAAGVAAFAAYVLAAVRSRVALAGDVVSVDEPFVHRRLRREEIAGRRLVPAQYGMWFLDLVPLRPHQKKVRIGSTYETDAAFTEWIAPLRDLDAEEADETVAAVRDELAETFGRRVAPEELARRFATARKVTRALAVASYAAAAWGFFLPRPYPLAVAALGALPVLAVAVAFASRGVVSIDERRNDPRPSVAIPVMLPGAVLGLRTLLDVSLVAAAPALVAAVLAGAALALAATAADPALRRRPAMALLVGALLSFWGGGSVVQANVLLDRARPEVHAARVLEKRVSRGKHTSYDLALGPWGPVAEPGTVKVPRAVFDRVETGDAVAVLLRPGALGLPWYVVTVD